MVAFVVVPTPIISTPRRQRSTASSIGRCPSLSHTPFISGSIPFRTALPTPPRPARTAVRVAPTAVLGGGGFLGVGPAEVVVIVAVGWFLLGPTKMYELAKDSGKIIGQLRSAANEARENFEGALEFELEKEKEEKDKQKLEGVDGATDGSDDSKKDKEMESDQPSLPDFDLTSLSTTATASAAGAGNTSASSESASSEAETNDSRQFLDQLKRVADPNQTALSDVPDLEADLQYEEREVKRLEQQYLEARARLNERKESTGSELVNNTTDPHSVSEAVNEQADNSSGSKTIT